MDPVIAKVIVSRKKSIATIESEIVKFTALAKSASPQGAVAIQSIINVKAQRLAKLREELAGLEAVDDRQVELPGTAPQDPPAPGPVTGKGRRP